MTIASYNTRTYTINVFEHNYENLYMMLKNKNKV